MWAETMTVEAEALAEAVEEAVAGATAATEAEAAEEHPPPVITNELNLHPRRLERVRGPPTQQ